HWPQQTPQGTATELFLGPPQSDCGQPRDRRQRTESGKPDAKRRGPQRTSSLEQELCLEMQLLRARNARLIGQLREKSGQLSVAETRADKLGREIDQFRAQKRFDASMEKISARTQMGGIIETRGPETAANGTERLALRQAVAAGQPCRGGTIAA
uniref:Transposase n=1 Tax=Globodera pallida TaxID=36090 RepID=A0A183CTU1_GLOPA